MNTVAPMRACRLRKLYEKSGDCKGMTLESALQHKPSPNVKAAKQAQAKVKRCGRNSGEWQFVPCRSPADAADRRGERGVENLSGRMWHRRVALFVLETVMPHA